MKRSHDAHFVTPLAILTTILFTTSSATPPSGWTTYPEDTVALEGSQLTFHCQPTTPNNFVLLRVNRLVDSGPILVLNDITYSVVGRRNPLAATVTIKNFTKAAEGRYLCRALHRSTANDLIGPVAWYTIAVPPGPPGKPVVTSFGADFVVLEWTSGFDGHGTISGYKIQFQTVSNKWKQYKEGKTIVGSPARLDDLIPNSNYYFKVKAVNEVGRGDFSPSSEEVVTNPLPPPKVENVKINDVKPTEFTVTWDAPLNLKATHGKLRLYTVRYFATREGVNGAKFMNTADETDKDMTIRGLAKGTEYTVNVAAYNRAALGAYSDAQTTLTTPDVSIHFDPSLEVRKGESVTVICRAVSTPLATSNSLLRNGSPIPENSPPKSPSKSEGGIVEWSYSLTASNQTEGKYHCEASNSGGTGKSKEITLDWLLPPDEPNIKASNVSNVCWTTGFLGNPLITNYTLSCTTKTKSACGDKQLVTVTTTVAIPSNTLSNDILCANLSATSPSTGYTCSVKASNGAYDVSSANTDVSLDRDKPGPVTLDPVSNVNNTEFTLTWCVSFTGAIPLKHSLIGLPDTATATFTPEFKTDTQKWTATVTQVEPQTTFNVKVKVSNSGGEAESNQLSVTTTCACSNLGGGAIGAIVTLTLIVAIQFGYIGFVEWKLRSRRDQVELKQASGGSKDVSIYEEVVPKFKKSEIPMHESKAYDMSHVTAKK